MKIEYKGHVFLEPVRPEFVNRFLHYLNVHSPLYSDIEINTDQIPDNLTTLEEPSSSDAIETDDNVDFQIIDHLITFQKEYLPIEVEHDNETDNDELEQTENPLDVFRTAASETALISNVPESIEACTIAPGEGKNPVSML